LQSFPELFQDKSIIYICLCAKNKLLSQTCENIYWINHIAWITVAELMCS